MLACLPCRSSKPHPNRQPRTTLLHVLQLRQPARLASSVRRLVRPAPVSGWITAGSPLDACRMRPRFSRQPDARECSRGLIPFRSAGNCAHAGWACQRHLRPPAWCLQPSPSLHALQLDQPAILACGVQPQMQSAPVSTWYTLLHVWTNGGCRVCTHVLLHALSVYSIQHIFPGTTQHCLTCAAQHHHCVGMHGTR